MPHAAKWFGIKRQWIHKHDRPWLTAVGSPSSSLVASLEEHTFWSCRNLEGFGELSGSSRSRPERLIFGR
jgi:hypothetical protein